MYKKIFLATVIVILFSGYSDAQDPRGGNWWNNLDMGQKQMYIEGVADRIGLASMAIFHAKNVQYSRCKQSGIRKRNEYRMGY